MLSHLVCVELCLFAIVRLLKSSLVLPVGCRAKRNLFIAFVDVDWLLVNVAAAKDTGLKVLVLSLLGVEVGCLESRVCLCRFEPRVPHVDPGCHQVSALTIESHAMLLSGGPVQFLCDHVFHIFMLHIDRAGRFLADELIR